mmetsp:Transcript_58525/g.93036  ORF Transcript_58525/g.93036 Transcript_58525/m.93036 type:complete len:212 (-) Transcript_58525:797-1432(-)
MTSKPFVSSLIAPASFQVLFERLNNCFNRISGDSAVQNISPKPARFLFRSPSILISCFLDSKLWTICNTHTSSHHHNGGKQDGIIPNLTHKLQLILLMHFRVAHCARYQVAVRFLSVPQIQEILIKRIIKCHRLRAQILHVCLSVTTFVIQFLAETRQQHVANKQADIDKIWAIVRKFRVNGNCPLLVAHNRSSMQVTVSQRLMQITEFST